MKGHCYGNNDRKKKAGRSLSLSFPLATTIGENEQGVIRNGKKRHADSRPSITQQSVKLLFL
jgi:hypothetical protein